MNSNKITIVDFGLGNIYSVMRALQVCGATNICIGKTPSDIESADKVILPGVGAFKKGMHELRERKLDKSLLSFAASGRPMLGICLGMQLFSSYGDEFGGCAGLDLIPGRVVEMPRLSDAGKILKLPFIGWAGLNKSEDISWNQTILENCVNSDFFYLVHSFQFMPSQSDHLIAVYSRGNQLIPAVVRCKNIIGLQFHPEKSGIAGLKVLKNFIENDGN